VNELRCADVENGEQVRMVQRCYGARFLLEAAETVLIVREGRGEDLDGHVAAEARIARAVHFAHSSRSNERENFVRPKLTAGSEWQGGGIIHGPAPIRSTARQSVESPAAQAVRLRREIAGLATSMPHLAHIRCERLWNRQTCLWFWLSFAATVNDRQNVPIPLALPLIVSVPGRERLPGFRSRVGKPHRRSSHEKKSRCWRVRWRTSATLGKYGCGIGRLACDLEFAAKHYETHRQVCLFHRRAPSLWLCDGIAGCKDCG
jgi:hypothetical protein